MAGRDKIITGGYVTVWGVIIFGATFPSVFRELDFTFLTGKGNDISNISWSYLYALTMVIMLHFIDVAYCLYNTRDLGKEQLRKFSIANCLFVAWVAGFLISTVAFENSYMKIACFVGFWLGVLAIKYASIKLTRKTLTKKRVQLKEYIKN